MEEEHIGLRKTVNDLIKTQDLQHGTLTFKDGTCIIITNGDIEVLQKGHVKLGHDKGYFVEAGGIQIRNTRYNT